MLNAETQVKKGDDEIGELYTAASRIVSVSAVSIACFVAIFAKEILQIWVGSSIADSAHLLLSLLALTYGWNAANSIVAFYTLNGLGLAHLQARVSVSSALIMAIGAAVFVPIFGILGAACARVPETIFRFGIRMYVSRTVLRSVGTAVNFDFLRITVFGLMTGYGVKILIISVSGKPINFLSFSTDVVLLVSGGLVWFLLIQIEKWICNPAARSSKWSL